MFISPHTYLVSEPFTFRRESRRRESNLGSNHRKQPWKQPFLVARGETRMAAGYPNRDVVTIGAGRYPCSSELSPEGSGSLDLMELSAIWVCRSAIQLHH